MLLGNFTNTTDLYRVVAKWAKKEKHKGYCLSLLTTLVGLGLREKNGEALLKSLFACYKVSAGVETA